MIIGNILKVNVKSAEAVSFISRKFLIKIMQI